MSFGVCGLHATLALKEADSKGWFDDEHEAPKVSEASWESPKFDQQLMHRFLSDTSTADVSQPDSHADVTAGAEDPSKANESNKLQLKTAKLRSAL
ncbi:TPA: hypothetical protein ACH3X3_014218 [Trebouxia sp. C0006]